MSLCELLNVLKSYDRPGMVIHACNPSYLGGRRITSLRPTLAKIAKPCLISKLKAKGWEGDSSGKGTFLACTRPWVQPSLQQTKQKKMQE
jgi:hypothetical protein